MRYEIITLFNEIQVQSLLVGVETLQKIKFKASVNNPHPRVLTQQTAMSLATLGSLVFTEHFSPETLSLNLSDAGSPCTQYKRNNT